MFNFFKQRKGCRSNVSKETEKALMLSHGFLPGSSLLPPTEEMIIERQIRQAALNKKHKKSE
ncbi:hypothetical protein [Latilactobacillus curvatus]|uniref:hypothetical protein n=1 Tax=Latilactobacillus curvatus TaxID=28038 RepID=UPI000FECA0EC|nr:hypothetical protein [Latilactobacillus curvatus]QAR35204.1 hypothetical protein EQK21_03720 [Latilactobacillus curvatus]